VLATKAVVEQAFVPCINILNLAKKGRRELLEAACLEIKTREGIPTYSSVKNTMAAIDTARRLAPLTEDLPITAPEDTLGQAGMTRGADYYSLGGGK